MTPLRAWIGGLLLTAAAAAPVVGALAASAQSASVGTSFPAGFPEILDHSLGVPVIGFGSDQGKLTRTPVIFLHGNNDTPYPTDCNSTFGHIHDFAQHFYEHGYSPAELWGLGYQGDQCDLRSDPSQRSGKAHSTLANVPDLRRFVAAVLDYTGASQVDIVGHSLGTTLAREWMRRDDAFHLVRRLVGVDGPNHGIINCSPSPRNYWQLYAVGAFTPDSAICREYGSPESPLLNRLNARDETPGPTRYITIFNADTSFVFFSEQDGTIPPVPAEDREGRAHDFSDSARLTGAKNIPLQGQGQYDDTLLTAHLGIVNSPQTWEIAFEFLSTPGAR